MVYFILSTFLRPEFFIYFMIQLIINELLLKKVTKRLHFGYILVTKRLQNSYNLVTLHRPEIGLHLG